MMHTATVAESLQHACGALAAHTESARLDAEVLLCAVLGVDRSALIVRGPEMLTAPAQRDYERLVRRRIDGVPVAYLTGTREFWSLPLKVTPAVLVPRPETEILVEQALSLLPTETERSLLDLGTGSGAIALAIASERPLVRVTAVDIAPEALEVARDNARTLALPNIEWRLGSWFEAVTCERFDIIVANPPYVASSDPALGSLASEPLLALSSGPTGLEALEAIVASAASHLEDGGWLLLEHGSSQHPDLARVLARAGFCGIQCHHDYSGRPRVTRATLSSPH